MPTNPLICSPAHGHSCPLTLVQVELSCSDCSRPSPPVSTVGTGSLYARGKNWACDLSLLLIHVFSKVSVFEILVFISLNTSVYLFESLLIFILSMCLSASMCVWCLQRTQEDIWPLELDLQTVVICHGDAGN